MVSNPPCWLSGTRYIPHALLHNQSFFQATKTGVQTMKYRHPTLYATPNWAIWNLPISCDAAHDTNYLLTSAFQAWIRSITAQRSTAGLSHHRGNLPLTQQILTHPGQPGIYTDEQVADLATRNNTVHQRVGLFLTNSSCWGRISHQPLLPDGILDCSQCCVSQGGNCAYLILENEYQTPRTVELNEIHSSLRCFTNTLQNRGVEAGFDGCLHGANGYCLVFCQA